MRHWLPFLLILLVSHTPAHSGPWPRDPGAWFLSTQAVAEWGGTRDPDRIARLYAEHGLTSQVTLGFKLEGRQGNGLSQSGEIFARWHPDLQAVNLRLGLELALGRRNAPEFARQTDTTHRASLHLGRGFDSPLGPGWARLSMSAIGARARPFADRELLTQLGLRPTQRALVMLSASAFRDSDGTTVKLTPALGHEFRGGYTALIELTLAPSDPARRALGIALWRDF